MPPRHKTLITLYIEKQEEVADVGGAVPVGEVGIGGWENGGEGVEGEAGVIERDLERVGEGSGVDAVGIRNCPVEELLLDRR